MDGEMKSLLETRGIPFGTKKTRLCLHYII